MDPLSQGFLGAAASQAFFTKQLGRWSWGIGLLSGLAADVDVFFPTPGSNGSRMDAILFHRHFTHALVFIPIGALICALPFFFVPSLKQKRKAVYAAALVAYATHGLLDACTSYGTLLLWPFSSMRVSFDVLSIIDPIFTLPLVLACLIGVAMKKARPVQVGLGFAALYVCLCIVQQQRAFDAQQRLITSRFDHPVRQRVMPTLGNSIIWRSAYYDEQWIRMDTIRVPLFGKMTYVKGASVRRVTPDNPPIGIEKATTQYEEYVKFNYFADGYTGIVRSDEILVGDFRYGMGLRGDTPIWIMRLNPDTPNELPDWVRPRLSEDGEDSEDSRRRSLEQLWGHIKAPLPESELVSEVPVAR